MEAEVQPRRDTEVAASAAERPEQLRVLLRSREDDRSVGRHQLRTHEVVAGEAVLRGEVPDATAEREPAHARRADDAPGRDQAERLRRRVEVEPGRSAVGPGDPGSCIDLHATHRREVDHEPVVDRAVSGGIVPAPANGDVEPVRACEVECGRHVSGAHAANDDGGTPVDCGVEAPPCDVVLRVVGRDDGARERQAEIAQIAFDEARHVSATESVCASGSFHRGLRLVLGLRRVRALPQEQTTDGSRCDREERTDEEGDVVATCERGRLALTGGEQRVAPRRSEAREDREPERAAHHERGVDDP